jgi:hypothetical protein
MIFDGNAFSSVRFFVCRKPLFLLGCPQREKRGVFFVWQILLK